MTRLPAAGFRAVTVFLQPGAAHAGRFTTHVLSLPARQTVYAPTQPAAKKKALTAAMNATSFMIAKKAFTHWAKIQTP